MRERPVRGYGGRPASVRQEREVRVTVVVDEEALEKAVSRLGWRVYATNAPTERLSLEQAVLAYRGQYVIDRSMGRLKGRPLSLTPMYLQRDDRATGLIRLLGIGLRVLTLVEFVVRRNLAACGGEIGRSVCRQPQAGHGAANGGAPPGGLPGDHPDDHSGALANPSSSYAAF